MNGNMVNEISPVRAARAKLLKNGNILTVSGMAWSTWRKEGDIKEYDWNGNLVWRYKPPGLAHHDVERLENGNTLLVYQEKVPREYLKRVKEPKRRTTILSDVVLEVTPDKKIVWEWHGYEHLDLNWYNPLTHVDWMHTNTVHALPENRHYDAGDKRFKPGNVMISPRSLDTILLIDKETKEVVWSYHGNYNSGLQGQHDPRMIEKGLPGEGNILVFDNGSSTRRIFEVTEEGETVWEYTVPYPHRIGRAMRVPYDYCPQTEALGQPKETPVLPPDHVETRTPYPTRLVKK